MPAISDRGAAAGQEEHLDSPTVGRREGADRDCAGVFAMFQLNPAPFCMLDEVDAPLDDANTERYCRMVKRMSAQTQFVFISHSKITMEIAQQLVGVTMQEQGVSRVVEVDIDEALRLAEAGAV
jgi:chromosome segregation protein